MSRPYFDSSAPHTHSLRNPSLSLKRHAHGPLAKLIWKHFRSFKVFIGLVFIFTKHNFVQKREQCLFIRFIFSRMDCNPSAKNKKKLIWPPVDNLPLKCEIECLLIHTYQTNEYKCVYLPLNNESAALEWKAVCEVLICILVCQVILRAAVNTWLPLVITSQTESKRLGSYSWRSACLCEYLEAGDCMLTRRALGAGASSDAIPTYAWLHRPLGIFTAV